MFARVASYKVCHALKTVTHSLIYICSNRYQQRQDIFLNSTPDFYQFTPSSGQQAPSSQYAKELSQTRKAETARRVAGERHAQALIEVVSMELKMGIARRWQPSDPEYIDTLKYMTERDYHRALDKLHRLVVQRLFELSRLNLARTGTNITMILDTMLTQLYRLSYAYSYRKKPADTM